jgi:Flp pilus assembly protein TadG
MKRQRKELRRGAISVLAAVLSIVMLAVVAFCVDIGYVLKSKEELQRTADATALATCWEYANRLSEGESSVAASLVARATTSEYASYNEVTGKPVYVNANASNDPNGDVVFAYVSDLGAGADTFQTGDPNLYNAVRVRVRKDSSLNGEVPYFFARVFGLQGQMLRAEATAAIIRDVKGFQTPSDGSNLQILPFALDLETWNSWNAGQGSDNYTWDAENEQVKSGSDGDLEINLYPQGTDSSGNRGTVDIGQANNSTCDISRQIVDGISPQDMQALADGGRQLEFDASGNLELNGDTGISAGVKDELASIAGQPRVIPVFSTVVGPGNNAEYTIVKWVGIRVMDVKLTGPMSKKYVTIQSAPIICKGATASETPGTSSNVYSPVVLVK